MCVPADIAELRIRLINKDEHLYQCHQQPPQPLKDDICLSKPHAPNVFQHEDRHVQLACESLKDKRLSASDGPADAQPGNRIRAGRGNPWNQTRLEKFNQVPVADDVFQRVRRLFEFHHVFP